MKPIPNFSSYNITPEGEIINRFGRVLNPFDCNGYRRISLTDDDGSRKGVDVHRLVVSAYLGPIPSGMWVNHKNGDKSDNRLENLELTTPSENHRHARDVLKRRYKAKNTDRDEAIAILLNLGWSQHRISRALGISQPAVSERVSKEAP